MPTSPGYADISIQLKNAASPRKAFITFGVHPTPLDPNTIAQQVGNAVGSTGSLRTRFDSNVTIGPTFCRFGVDGEEDHLGIDNLLQPGLNVTVSMPANVSVLAVKRTARGGRRGRGRLFLPWYIGQGAMDEAGMIDSSTTTVLQNSFNIFLGLLTTNGVPMVVLHKTSDPAVIHPTPPGPPNLVTSLTLDPMVSTQRRRLGR